MGLPPSKLELQREYLSPRLASGYLGGSIFQPWIFSNLEGDLQRGNSLGERRAIAHLTGHASTVSGHLYTL